MMSAAASWLARTVRNRCAAGRINAYFRVGFSSLVFLAVVPSGACYSEVSTSPVGVWKTFDDGKARGFVRIYEQDGKLFGRIEQSFTPGDEHRTCAVCTDERKNQPIIGLIMLRNMKQDGGEYKGGDILDPDSGSVYRCKMHLEKDGTRLVVRGYIGFSILGHSTTWERQS